MMSSIAGRPVRWWPFAVATPAVLVILVVAKVHAGHTKTDPILLAAAALVFAVVVAAVWLARPSWNFSAGFALSMFGSHWQSLHLPHSVAPDRIVLGLALIALVVRAPGARDRPPIRFRPLYVVMYVAGAYAVGSALAHHTLTSHSGLFALLDRMQIWDWAVLIGAPAAFHTRSDRRVLLWTMVGMGVYIGFTGIFEILGPHRLVFPSYIMDPKVGVQFGRARGPFADSVINGLALYLCGGAAILALRETRKRIPRVIAYAAITTCSISLILTFQRSDWLGAAIALLITLLVVRELRKFVIPVIVGTVLITGGLFIAVPTLREKANARIGDVRTIQGRQGLDAASVAMIEARPLFGFGWNEFSNYLPDYLKTSNSYSNYDLTNNPVHDVYFSIGTELGLVGLTLWLLVLFWAIGGAVFNQHVPREMRPWQILLGSLFVMWLVVATSVPLAAQFESLLLYLPAAVIYGAERRPGARVGRDGSYAG